ncbi:MAG: NYN domain-containing protein [Chloroflexota bacterium]|nr:NYN domain-containing protein [Chloroflexota bacterium]MDE2969654.1 NYN domain-containing protein [Chloroflexota bacterium]
MAPPGRSCVVGEHERHLCTLCLVSVLTNVSSLCRLLIHPLLPRLQGARLPYGSLSFCGRLTIRTNVYIDGFNLYYRAVRGTPYRWLDLGKLAGLLLPRQQVNRIRYFTALVKNRPNDPTQAQRQQAFLRVLTTVPSLTIHYGSFLEGTKRRPLAHPSPSLPQIVEIVDTEEKGSDVNLATYLLLDGFERDYDQAVVISNDSDLTLPIQMVRDKLGMRVGVIDPSARRSFGLASAATWYRHLRQGVLKISQFPDTLHDARGPITKPASW